MTSSFGSIKEKLNAEYGGRYLAFVLKEVIEADPVVLPDLFPASNTKSLKSDIEVRLEFPFKTKEGNKRRADLAILKEGKVVAALEIKDEDNPLEGQLDDYLQFVKSHGCIFTYLTHYRPNREDSELLAKSPQTVHMLFADLCSKLARFDTHTHPAVNLFCKYMEDEKIMSYTTDIDLKAVKLLLIKGNKFRHDTGLGRMVTKDNVKAIPMLWSQLFNNIDTICDRFSSEFPDYFNKRFCVYFNFDPEFNVKKLREELDEAEDESTFISQGSRTAGSFIVYGGGKIAQQSSDDWLRIDLGYEFYISLKEKTLSQYLWAEISGRDLEDVWVSKKVPKIPDENECYKLLLRRSVQAIESSMKTNPKMLSGFKKSLSSLNKDIKASAAYVG